MTTYQNKGFDDLFLSQVITSMDQENIVVVVKGEDTKPMAILLYIYQCSAFPFPA